ncbi:MAG: FGGY family carbohydrate kinase, partial [Lachnospiraceae bacterium]
DEMLIRQYTAEKFFTITGVVPNQSFSLCKLLWMKKNCPEVLQKAKAIYFADDYYNYLLSGNRGVDSATASKTLLFDIHENDWSDELLEEFELQKDWFSPVRTVGDALGTMRKEIAEELGLPSNIRMFMGCHDQCSATLGGGAYEPGMLVMGEGSTESINLIVDDSVFLASKELIRQNMCVEPFLEPGLYMVPCAFLTYGNAIRWYIRTFEEQGGGRQDIFSYLEDNAQKKTDLVFLPHLSKVNIMDPESKVPGAFLGITLDTERWEFYRAMLQGLNFESRMNLETLSKLGFLIRHISATGGIANSLLFMQLKANVLQREIHVFKNNEAGIMGLAMICATACGDYKSHAQAFAGFVREKQIFYPSEKYEELFLQYKEYRSRLR